MNFRDLIGIYISKIEWNKVFSLILSLCFPFFIKFLLSFYKNGPDSEIIISLIPNISLLIFSILVINFIRLKNEFVSICVISILTGLLSGFLNFVKMGLIDFVHFILYYFVMLYTWTLLIRIIKKRKLVLVIGYLFSSLLSVSFVILNANSKYPEITNLNLDFKIITPLIIWSIYFWIGLLIFDKIFKIKNVT